MIFNLNTVASGGGGAPTLTPTPSNTDEEWYVQFLTSSEGGYGELNSSLLFGGETVSLTVYG